LALLAAVTVCGGAQWIQSSPTINVVVTRTGRPLKGARVTFHVEIEHGERDVWTGLTGVDGSVSPAQLSEGKYRIIADGGAHTGGLLVEVMKSNAERSRYEIVIAADDEPYVLQWEAASAWSHQFRGTIQDEFGGLIPGVNIRIFRRNADKKDEVGHTQSDKRGAFSIDLDSGKYEAILEGRFLKQSIIPFEVGKQGLKALRLTMLFDLRPQYSGVDAAGTRSDH